ncbi:MAG: ribosome silencing factor [Clostridia bacterium]|nr:ribosome silencing factor [Clostridia bacterium]
MINKEKITDEAKLANAVADALEGKKALDVQTLKVSGQTVLADYFVPATGTSSTHVSSLADEVEYKIKEELGIIPSHIEGKTSWILLDYGTVIVHVFTAEAREFYKLEKLWNEGITE